MRKSCAIFLFGLLCIGAVSNEKVLFKDDKRLPQIQTARLVLNGKKPLVQDNEVDLIQDFIVDKLRLPHLRWKVLQAKNFYQQGILFEMASVDEAAQVLKQAEQMLNRDIFWIEPAGDLDFYQLSFAIRNNFD